MDLTAKGSARRRIALGLLVASLTAFGASASAEAGTLYVANGGSENVSAIDTASGKVIASPATGKTPEVVVVTPDGSKVLVSNRQGGSVTPIDTATNTDAAPAIGVGELPIGIAVSPNGDQALVAVNNDAKIAVIDPRLNAISGTEISSPGFPLGVAYAPDGSKAYVSVQPDLIYEINLATREVVGEGIEVGNLIVSMQISADGTRLYASSVEGDGIFTINTATHEVIGAPIKFPGGVAASQLSADGSHLYVEGSSGEIGVVDTATGNLTGGLLELEAATQGGLQVTPDGSRLFFSERNENNVGALSTSPLALTSLRIPVSEEPLGMSLTPSQTPQPSLAVSLAGDAATLDASASTDPHGQIASYSWDFGDGSTASGTSPTATHTYKPGKSYAATVSVDNGDGCKGFVYTGQTALCNGPSTATKSITIAVPAAGKLTLGKLKLNKKKGTAMLAVGVPGAGSLVGSGKGLVKQKVAAKKAGSVKLAIKPNGKTKKKLASSGAAKVTLKLDFTEQGGGEIKLTKKVKLVKKAAKK